MYESPSARRRIGPALVTFLVVLAVVAGLVGYLGTTRLLAGESTVTAGPARTGPTPTGPTTTGSTTTGPTSPSTALDPTASRTPAGPSASPSGQPPLPGPTTVARGVPSVCPAPTAAALRAAGLDDTLTVKLYVETGKAGVGNAELWVCQNASGLLVYQGHVLKSPLTKADNSDDTILLAAGVKGNVVTEGGGFLATNPGPAGSSTEYHITAVALTVIDRPAGKLTAFPAIFFYPPGS